MKSVLKACIGNVAARIPGGVAAALLLPAMPGLTEAQVAERAEEICPVLVGEPVPAAEVRDAEGEAHALADLLGAHPTVLVFYRGGWCPYCTRHLSALRTVIDELDDLGVQLVAVSPDRPEKLRPTREKQNLGYQLLSDSDMNAARALGIAFKVSSGTRETYDEYGIDLEEASGRDHHLLPVPAVFVVDRDGTIRFVHANPDYKSRLDPAVMMAVVRAVTGAP